MQRIVIAGCGYIGSKVASLWSERGAETTCMVRSQEKVQNLQALGIRALASSFDAPENILFPDISGSIIYYFVPPPGGGIYDTRARNFIEILKKSPKPSKVIYMSATSVYSETNGGVVTEDSPTIPHSAMGRRRLDAENSFLEYGISAGISVIILRVSGIYGPGRLPLMQISHRQPLLREEDSGPSNRIHAVDLANICIAAADRGKNGDIFNVSDGHPTSMTSYFNACADLLRYPRQPQISLEEARLVMTPLMLSYVTELRVVDNARMLDRLNIHLMYPTMMDGLQNCI